MKVVFIVNSLSDGGSERVASIITNYLSMKGYDVSLILSVEKKIDYVVNDNIKIYSVAQRSKFSIFRGLKRAIEVKRVIKELSPDLIISFLSNEIFFSLNLNIPIIYSVRNDPGNTSTSFLNNHIRNKVLNKSNFIIFQTEGAKNYFGNKFNSKSKVIFNPIDVTTIPTWNNDLTSKDFICPCRLVPQKNITMLIESFSKIVEKYPDYNLKIYGEGYMKDDLLKQINFNKVSNNIFIYPRTNNIFDILTKSLCYVLPSNFEGLSNGMLEALSIGIPCIVTDSPPGGARTFIRDKVNGLLVDVDSVDHMHSAIEYIINNKEDLLKISNNSIQVRDVINTDTICTQWIDIINNIVGDKQ